jgi:hypothetical protein
VKLAVVGAEELVPMDVEADRLGMLGAMTGRRLGLTGGDVVLGGGMLRRGDDPLVQRVTPLLPTGAPADAPVLDAGLAAFEAVGAPPASQARLRDALQAGLTAA